MHLRPVLPLLVIACAGCSRSPDLMPMQVGMRWTYTVRSGMETFVEPVKVVREVPAAGVRGYELAGNLGVSRVGWRNGVLFAESMVNCRFHPPLPIVAENRKSMQWVGILEAMGKSQKANATTVISDAKLVLPGQTVATKLSTITIQTPKTIIELKTWFQPRVGIVQQEQRTADKLDVGIQLQNAP